MIASFFKYEHRLLPLVRIFPSNTVANPRGELKAITTRSGLVLDGPFVHMPPPFINPEEDERVEDTLTDPKLAEYTSKVPPPLIKKAKPASLKKYVVHKRDLIFHLTYPYPLRMHQEKQQEKDESSSSPTITSFEESELIWEEFEAYLASDSFPPGNDDLPFDIESDLREIEYLLNHDPTKDMDSILEDLVDEGNLTNDLVDTIPEMFTNEHTLDYSSPPLYDDDDDDLVELESDNDDVYDDPFDFKEDKIKESKLLIDELDPPRSSDFLPSPKCDSVLYEDFSELDALPSTDNEDKVIHFKKGIAKYAKVSSTHQKCLDLDSSSYFFQKIILL
ncbi:hypothetical protein Tco_0380953 [Tanacetum coccineum]